MTTLQLSRRDWLAAAPLAAVAFAQDAGADAARFATLVLVRHAEKADATSPDPELSETGRARAQRLAALFARAGNARLIASEMKRTQHTLDPLARALGAKIEVHPAADVDRWTRLLCEGASPLTIAATHSNVLPRLAHALGATLHGLDAKGNLPEDEYGRVVILTARLDAKPATVAQLELEI